MHFIHKLIAKHSKTLTQQYKWFFGSWEEDVPFPGVDDTKNEPVTSMESQLIEKAQQHLGGIFTEILLPVNYFSKAKYIWVYFSLLNVLK